MSHIQNKVSDEEDFEDEFDPSKSKNGGSSNGNIINGFDKSELEMQPLTKNNGNGDSNKKMLLDPMEMEEGQDKDNKRGWKRNVHDFLFPPNLPRECQLLRTENIAIPVCYLLVGLLQGLSGPLINVYPLDLGATEAQQTTLSSIRGLPAAFKLVFGFISDNFPICGYRRKSYMIFGWLLAAVSMFSLIAFSDLSLVETVDEATGETVTTAPADAPSIPFLSLQMLLFGTGFWVADVMGDSVVAEKAKLEPPDARGSIQSSCYSYRFFGLMVAAPFSTGLYYHFGPSIVIVFMALLPLCILPLVFLFKEQKNIEVASTKEQCNEIWNTVCSRSVWQPLGFVYVYNLLQVGNAAWREFLRTTLGFTSEQLNYIYIASVVLLYLGVLTYKYFMMKYSWRLVYGVCTALGAVFSVLQVLLIHGITFGISDFWFALGDDAFMEFIAGIQFLPTTIMMVHLCPEGSEGASYAMFTTVNNAALNLSAAISTVMLGIWDVSKEALANGDLQGMVNLTWLTSAIQFSGIFFIGWLPKTREDLFALKEKANGFSKVGGSIFLFITIGSIIYSIVIGILNIIAPGWMGES